MRVMGLTFQRWEEALRDVRIRIEVQPYTGRGNLEADYFLVITEDIERASERRIYAVTDNYEFGYKEFGPAGRKIRGLEAVAAAIKQLDVRVDAPLILPAIYREEPSYSGSDPNVG